MSRWGILATGGIAASLAQAIQDTPEAELIAVASRTQAKADAFGDRWQVPRRYGRYADLVQDTAVDIVYIATPHRYHYQNMLLCLNAGKHVLCEKAFTLTAAQAAECINLARAKGLFLMEAMWMRYFPIMAQLRTWLSEGIIGTIRLVQADFCFNLPFDRHHRLYNLALGGGALLDLGIYPLSFATMILGLPDHVDGHAHLSQTGVDELDTVTLTYNNGATAVLSCSMRLFKPREAFVVGSQGYIKIHDIFFCPDTVTLARDGHKPETLHLPYRGNGYIHEVEEVEHCLNIGQTESHIMPLNETLALMQIMDDLLTQWGVIY